MEKRYHTHWQELSTKEHTQMALDLAVMRKRLEEKQAELQQHIAALTGGIAPPEDAIQASDGLVEPEEEAVDLEQTGLDQALLDNVKALLAEV